MWEDGRGAKMKREMKKCSCGSMEWRRERGLLVSTSRRSMRLSCNMCSLFRIHAHAAVVG